MDKFDKQLIDLRGDLRSLTNTEDGYIALKREETTRLKMTTHPVEFDMYYSL